MARLHWAANRAVFRARAGFLRENRDGPEVRFCRSRAVKTQIRQKASRLSLTKVPP